MKKHKKHIVTIKNIRDSIYDADLDGKYWQAVSYLLQVLGYTDDPMEKMYLGTTRERAKMSKIDITPLTSNQVSELMYLLINYMREDIQFSKFKKLAEQYINIANEMRSTNIEDKNINKIKEKPKIYSKNMTGFMYGLIGQASETLRANNMFEESREMVKRASLSYSYEDALNVITEYIEIIKEDELEEELE